MIDVCNISKRYGKTDILCNVSFTLNKGNLVALLGVNGAGKSTTMNIMTGILKTDTGSVFIDKINITENLNKTKQKIGYLHESNPLYEDMYVKEYLEYIAHLFFPKKEVAKHTDFIIEQIGLTKEYRKKIYTLSKGNKQRVGLAQALIHDPEILILDEPMSGFDPNQQYQMKELLFNLKDSKTILFSTHHLEEAVDIASSFLILNKGKLILDENAGNISSINDLFYSLINENNCR